MFNVVDKKKLSEALTQLPEAAEDKIKSMNGFYWKCLNDTRPFKVLQFKEVGLFNIPIVYQVSFRVVWIKN